MDFQLELKLDEKKDILCYKKVENQKEENLLLKEFH